MLIDILNGSYHVIPRAIHPSLLILAQTEDALLQLVLLDLHHQVRPLQVARELLELIITQRFVLLPQGQETLRRHIMMMLLDARGRFIN